MRLKLIISDLAGPGHYVSREMDHVMKQFIDDHGWKHIKAPVIASQRRFLGERIKAMKLLARAVSDIILAFYAPIFGKFFLEAVSAKRVVWVLHSASPALLLPLKYRAEDVVLSSGGTQVISVVTTTKNQVSRKQRTLGESTGRGLP